MANLKRVAAGNKQPGFQGGASTVVLKSPDAAKVAITESEFNKKYPLCEEDRLFFEKTRKELEGSSKINAMKIPDSLVDWGF